MAGLPARTPRRAEEELDRLEALVDDLLALAGAATAASTGTTVDLLERDRGRRRTLAGACERGREDR